MTNTTRRVPTPGDDPKWTPPAVTIYDADTAERVRDLATRTREPDALDLDAEVQRTNAEWWEFTAELQAEVERLGTALKATRRAKAENDERFQIEAQDQRARADAAEDAVARVRELPARQPTGYLTTHSVLAALDGGQR